jgi:hypothetical protein
MTEGEKTSKLKGIRETVSDAAEIMTHLGKPEVQKSVDNIMDTAKLAKEIIESLKTPQMVKNIENFCLISENINEASTKMQNTLMQLEQTGVINEVKELIQSTKGVMNSFDGSEGAINGQDLHEMSTAIKEMFKSVRALVDELRITVAYSIKSGAIHNMEETVKEASDIYKTTLGYKDYSK